MKKKILIIDDDEVLCEELAELLEENGYVADKAFDGALGEEMIKRGEYDLILLDIKVPSRSGLEILKNIKDEKTLSKILVVSAHAVIHQFMDQHTELATADCADEFRTIIDGAISKPYDVDSLLLKIKELLG